MVRANSIAISSHFSKNLTIFLKPRNASCFSLILEEKQAKEHNVTVWLSLCWAKTDKDIKVSLVLSVWKIFKCNADRWICKSVTHILNSLHSIGKSCHKDLYLLLSQFSFFLLQLFVRNLNCGYQIQKNVSRQTGQVYDQRLMKRLAIYAKDSWTVHPGDKTVTSLNAQAIFLLMLNVKNVGWRNLQRWKEMFVSRLHYIHFSSYILMDLCQPLSNNSMNVSHQLKWRIRAE